VGRKRPASSVAAHWIEAAAPRRRKPPPPWWRVWRSFWSLIDTAYHNNLSLQVAGARVLQAQAQLQVAIGQLFPQQQALTGEVQHQRLSRDTPLTVTSDPNLRTSQIGVGATWELDFWGKYRRGIESDRAAMLASLAAYDNALVSLTAGVASDYLNIRTLPQRIQVAQATQTKESLHARTQFENGETSELDVEQASRSSRRRRRRSRAWRTRCAPPRTPSRCCSADTDRIDEQLGAGTTIPTAPGAVATGMPRDLPPPPRRAASRTAAAAQSAGIGVAKSNLYPRSRSPGASGT
jgi:hypothetical protein